MAKKSNDEMFARRLMVLKQICKHKEGVDYAEITELIPEKYKVAENTIKKDVEYLKPKFPIIESQQGKVYVPVTGIQEIWSGTKIGERLIYSESKSKLAKAAFSFVEKNKKKITQLVLGTGTTVHECARELINGESALENMRIYTANLLVLHEFVYHKPSKLVVELPRGELDLERAALRRTDVVEYFQNLEVNAVITSFSDMSFEKGFCTDYEDKEEKLANLCPNFRECHWVIIPIEWSKIGSSVSTPVAESRDEQLNFAGGRKYVIITDKPSEQEWDAEVDDGKLEDLLKWKETYPNGIEILDA